MLIAPSNGVMVLWAELSQALYLEAESKLSGICWHERMVHRAGVEQTVRLCGFLIGQKLQLVVSQLSPGQFPEMTFKRCQQEEHRDSTAEPRHSFTLWNLFSEFSPPLYLQTDCGFLEHILHLKLLSKYFPGLVFKVSSQHSMLKIQTILVEWNDGMMWAQITTGCIFRCKDSHPHLQSMQIFCQKFWKGVKWEIPVVI